MSVASKLQHIKKVFYVCFSSKKIRILVRNVEYSKPFWWRHDTQHNNIQHNDTQHNDIPHNNHGSVIVLSVVMLGVIMLNVTY